VGYLANGYCYGAAVGYQADGDYGAAVGHLANGYYGAAVGASANGYYYGAAMGRSANGCCYGAAMGRSANADCYGAAMGAYANGYYRGAAVGYYANGYSYGAAVGYHANGRTNGAAVGAYANGFNHGSAMGRSANGYCYGAAVGYQANGHWDGAAMGAYANGYYYGAAVGCYANGDYYGAAVGSYANGYCRGAAMGRSANAYCYGVALGADATTSGGSQSNPRIAIGYMVNNDVNNTCRIRGKLYLDGSGSGNQIYYRTTFGSGSWSSKAFVIDHPLDPKNKVLRHACLEGPKVWNVYAGTIILDGKGEAVVALPDYFVALNKAPQYQLTAVGASMPGLYIKEKVKNNFFKIAGGIANAEVCWEVKGERNDIAVRDNPMVVEEKKAVPGLVYRR